MLQATFMLKMEEGKEIKLSHARCMSCDNVFFVEAIGENEPSFCCYCGTKFKYYTKEDGQKLNLGGFPLKEA